MDRELPIPIVSIPATIGAIWSLYLLWTGQVTSMDPWLAVLFIFIMVVVGIAGTILVKKGLTAQEDVITIVLYGATPGSVLILTISGIITFIHVIYRRLAGLTSWEYTRNGELYSYFPYPILTYTCLAYCFWLASTLRVI